MKNPLAHPFVIFLIKKIIFYAVVMFVAVTFVFFIPRLIPGNPVERLLPRGQSTPGINWEKIREDMMKYYGFDKSPLEQYITFWQNLLRGDLGVSISLFPGNSVVSIVGSRIPYTLELVIPVLIISFLLGNWIGAKAAYIGGKLSNFIYFLSVFSNRLPSFWFGMVLVYLLAIRFHIFPPYGYQTLEIRPMLWWDISTWNPTAFLDKLRYFCLPFISLFIVYLGGWATGMRAMVIHELDSGYIRYAEALGFRKNKVQSYAQRNAILPQFTGLNLYLNALIGETTVVETVFGWPGVGRLMYQSVVSQDYSVIFGSFLVVMIVVVVGNFIIDVLYGLVDPRIRIGGRA